MVGEARWEGRVLLFCLFALAMAILSAAILRRSSFLARVCCFALTLFECGDPSPLFVVSLYLEARRTTRETTDSGEGSPHSKRVTTKQQRETSQSGERSPQ